MDIASMTLEELTEYIKEKKLPGFRAKQIFEWLHKHFIYDPSLMTNLSNEIREKIKADIPEITEETRLVSEKDGTIKFLMRMPDGQMIETVFMRYHHGNSVCISSQAGCRMGCRFCASTIGGLVRNLAPSEMLYQVYHAMKVTGERVSNIVIMGTGEPLDNYDNVMRFIELITDEKGYNLSERSITLSSCGLVPKIKELADRKLQITFALSLHATTDEERKALMPVAERYTLKETLDACRYYFEKTGRRLTFEYSLVRGVNDSEGHAKRLAALIKGMNAHVNLIPVNPVEERSYKGSETQAVDKFKNILEKYRINVTIRKGMGSDIDAACGQLRRKYGIKQE
ncbi:MAG TPA: 23S rRNA (adenine(2503)-C(2))-methyltransferase RlmN [Lachnospiraceae bacterium]|nr:23S rRNA (adenine(2503)-C(2))-methyltransferase RlmN [Lachnospiraceae bacterium]